MNLPLPAHQLTLEELYQYAGNDPVCAVLYERIKELETELEKEKEGRDIDNDEYRDELWDMEQQFIAAETELRELKTKYDELETRFLALKEEGRK